jgi:hypothetical protein
MYVIGVDPGPIPGVVRLQLADRQPTRLVDVQALQVTPGLIATVLDALSRDDHTVLAVERFVIGPRAARSSTPQAGAATRVLLMELEAWAGHRGVKLYARSAAEVKPWATDNRLEAARLIAPTHQMRHARDAGRHALFCAVRDCGLADPLSTKAGAR